MKTWKDLEKQDIEKIDSWLIPFASWFIPCCLAFEIGFFVATLIYLR